MSHLADAAAPGRGGLVSSPSMSEPSRHPPLHSLGAVCASCFVVAALLALGLPSVASASLTLLKPSPSDQATFHGNGGYSADGLGQYGTGGAVQADVPAGSTVVQAYLYGSYYF